MYAGARIIAIIDEAKSLGGDLELSVCVILSMYKGIRARNFEERNGLD